MTIIYNRSSLNYFRKELRSNMTKSEVVLWKHIKGNQLGHKFRRQFSIGDHAILDFYCPTLKFAVEVDGLTHADEKVFEKDVAKQKYIEQLGVTLKRYSSEQVFNHLDQVLEDIYQTCILLEKKIIFKRRTSRTATVTDDPSLPPPFLRGGQ